MGVLDEIKSTVIGSITKEKANTILENLITRAIKQHAKNTFDAFMKEVKGKAASSNYKIENEQKVIAGKIDLGEYNSNARVYDSELSITPSTKEEVDACYMFQNHSQLFLSHKAFKDITCNYEGTPCRFHGDFLAFRIQYIGYSTEKRKIGFLNTKEYFSFFLTNSGKIFYDEFLNYVKEDQKCFELIATTYYHFWDDIDGPDYSNYEISFPSEELRRKSRFHPEECYRLCPQIKYRIIC